MEPRHRQRRGRCGDRDGGGRGARGGATRRRCVPRRPGRAVAWLVRTGSLAACVLLVETRVNFGKEPYPIAESQGVRAATAHPISRSQDVRGRQSVAGCAGCPGSPSGTAHPIAESQDVRAATAHPISRSQDVRGRQSVAGCAGCPGSPSGTAHPIAESQDVRAATAHPISRSQDVRGRQSVAQHNTLSQSRRMCAVVAGCAGCPAARPITRAGSPSGTAHPIAESQDVPAHFPERVARRRP